ncbi:MAG: helical backbone metal receptor [Flavobacteriaceae bacterium]|nr:helical backbone metal receptor [Flavobacteriaceae bacterium]
MKFKDQLNRNLYLDNNPQRIVSLVPSQTELLVDLGLEENIVGITKYCVHPTHLKGSKTIVGGTKKVNYKKIAALNPDIIICNKEENTEEIVSELEKHFSVYVSDIITFNDTFNMIADFGDIFNSKPIALQLINSIQSKLDDFNSFIEQYSPKKVAYFIWPKPWMVAGGKNYINETLKLNKFENIFENAPDRYLEVYIEYLVSLNFDLKPELIILPSEPFHFKKEHVEKLKKFIDCQFIFVDGEMFSWYGSRLLKALDYFKNLHKHIN